MFKNKKFVLRIVGFFSVMVILIAVSLFQFFGDGKSLEVVFFDVGQGDAILIKTPERQKILVDGGPDNKIAAKVGENLPFYVKDIDLVILTHPHADHLVGLVEILKRYEVKKILTTGVLHTSDEYIAWLTEIKKQKIPVEIASAGQIIKLGSDTEIKILYPAENFSEKRVKSLNNTSIVFKLIFGETSFLFTGDAENEVETKLLDSINLKSDVLKVAHHGSKSSTSQEFLAEVDPAIAIISVGSKNKFGHPSPMVIKRLERTGAQILRTDKNGDIKIVSDGIRIKIQE